MYLCTKYWNHRDRNFDTQVDGTDMSLGDEGDASLIEEHFRDLNTTTIRTE